MKSPKFNTYIVTASKYSVIALRSPAAKPKLVLRYLRLQDLKVVQGKITLTPFANVNIAFFEKSPKKLGIFTADKGLINVHTDLADFDDMYEFVRLATKVSFMWTEDQADKGVIFSYQLSVPVADMGAGC